MRSCTYSSQPFPQTWTACTCDRRMHRDSGLTLHVLHSSRGREVCRGGREGIYIWVLRWRQRIAGKAVTSCSESVNSDQTVCAYVQVSPITPYVL